MADNVWKVDVNKVRLRIVIYFVGGRLVCVRVCVCMCVWGFGLGVRNENPLLVELFMTRSVHVVGCLWMSLDIAGWRSVR